MPITGPGPKPEAVRRSHTPPVHEWREVVDEPFKGGPDLKRRPRANGRAWPEAALRKWAIWRRMPHCSLWRDADWEFALDTVELVAQLAEARDREGNPAGWPAALTKELRDRERVMGTTLDYRRSLRIRYVPAGGPVPREVANLADYRSL